MSRFNDFRHVARRLMLTSVMSLLALGFTARAQPGTEEGAVGLAELKKLVAAKLPLHLTLSGIAIDKMEQKGGPQMQVTTGTLTVVAAQKEDHYVAQGSEAGKMSLYLSGRQGDEVKVQATVMALIPAEGLGQRSVNVVLGTLGASVTGKPLSFYPADSYTVARDETGAVRRLPAGAAMANADSSTRSDRSSRARSARAEPPKDASPGPRYEGHWIGNLAPVGARGPSVELSLWRTASGQLAGVAYYGEACSSYLSETQVEGPVVSLKEEWVDGYQCTPTEALLTLTPVSQFLSLQWRAQPTTQATASTLRTSTPSPALQALSDAMQRGPDAAQKAISARAAKQTDTAAAAQAAATQLRKQDAAGTETQFPETLLLGSWRGSFVDAGSVVPAELVLWSGTYYGYRKLGGYLSFLDRPCTAYVGINQDRGKHIFGASTQPVVSAQPNCQQGSRGHALGFGTGTVEMSKDGTSLYLYADPFTGLDGHAPPKCLTGLARAGCWALGRFVRASLSPAMRVWVEGSPPKDFTPPTADMLTMLSSGLAAIPALQAEHATQAARNEGLAAAQRATQDRAAEAARQADAAARQRDRARQAAQADAARKGANLASQSGPFDGLDGSAYLNALYHGDVAELRRQDIEYALAWQRGVAEFVGKKDAKTQPLDDEHRKMTLSNIVYKTYIQAYGSRYSDCLRDGAMKITTTRAMQGSVLRNAYGVELWRNQGWSTEFDAVMNAEFVDIYKRVYDTESPNLPQVLLEASLGGHKSSLIGGVKALMAKYKCDSDVIKTLEQKMLAVFAPLHPEP